MFDRPAFDRPALFTGLDDRAELAFELDGTPSRLTNRKTARFADRNLARRITQWLGRPAKGVDAEPILTP